MLTYSLIVYVGPLKCCLMDQRVETLAIKLTKNRWQVHPSLIEDYFIPRGMEASGVD